ncbi:MAG: hypothetical protein ABIP20_07805 [Chthoniobacteraceae bacterium]
MSLALRSAFHSAPPPLNQQKRKMKTEPKTIWNRFKTAFSQALDETGRPKFLDAWRSVRDKTEFYEWTLMPAVGNRFEAKVQIERLRCDYTFLDHQAAC